MEHKSSPATLPIPSPSLESSTVKTWKAHKPIVESHAEIVSGEMSFAPEINESKPVSLELDAQAFTAELRLAADEVEADAWLEEAVIPEMPFFEDDRGAAEVLSESRTIVLVKITEVIAPPESVAEKTEVLLSNLSEAMQISLAEFVQESEPETVEAVSELVVQMALAADRL